MPTVLLVRHGRTTANASGVLAGRTPGVVLDDTGRAQAGELASRVTGLPVSRVVTSPLTRCLETAQAAADAVGVLPVTDDRLAEADYGDWTGQPLSTLSRSALWRVVQNHPSAAVFPGEAGEAMADVAHRAVQAVREHDADVAAASGDTGLWMAVSHGDVIKAVLADALGAHLDLVQRIVVDPCSVSVVRYTTHRPFVLRMNDAGGSLDGLRRRRTKRRRASDADVGGGAGDS